MVNQKKNRITKINSGAVAQLGERFNGIEEVVGSIPISSTKTKIIDYNLNLSPRYTLLTSLLFNNLSDDPDAIIPPS